jgi:hypothetical protein
VCVHENVRTSPFVLACLLTLFLTRFIDSSMNENEEIYDEREREEKRATRLFLLFPPHVITWTCRVAAVCSMSQRQAAAEEGRRSLIVKPITFSYRKRTKSINTQHGTHIEEKHAQQQRPKTNVVRERAPKKQRCSDKKSRTAHLAPKTHNYTDTTTTRESASERERKISMKTSTKTENFMMESCCRCSPLSPSHCSYFNTQTTRLSSARKWQ